MGTFSIRHTIGVNLKVHRKLISCYGNTLSRSDTSDWTWCRDECDIFVSGWNIKPSQLFRWSRHVVFGFGWSSGTPKMSDFSSSFVVRLNVVFDWTILYLVCRTAAGVETIFITTTKPAIRHSSHDILRLLKPRRVALVRSFYLNQMASSVYTIPVDTYRFSMALESQVSSTGRHDSVSPHCTSTFPTYLAFCICTPYRTYENLTAVFIQILTVQFISVPWPIGSTGGHDMIMIAAI